MRLDPAVGETADRVIGGPGTDIYKTDAGDIRRAVEVQGHCATISIPPS
jgi:hypothetical protein